MDNSSDLSSEDLAALQQAFVARLPEWVGRVEILATKVTHQAGEPAALPQLRRLVGQLAIRSAMLGYPAIETAARAVEAAAAKPLEAARPVLEGCLTPLRQAAQQVWQAAGHSVSTEIMHTHRARRLIYLVEDDAFQAQRLAAQVGYYGYTVQVFLRLADLKTALLTTLPTAVVMDVVFPEGELAGAEILASVQKTLTQPLPVIFVSANSDFASRLQAMRAGGRAYFVKPVEAAALVETLDRLTGPLTVAPYRVLIVEDSVVQATLFSQQLQRAGMETLALEKRTELITALADFKPDLILLDMYMPECTGIELASVIRQMDAYTSLPIVYLSSETDRDRQLEALGVGGDDFLSKPIKAEHLVAAVTSRAQRYHQLRDLLVRDGLTGLLNHTTIKERLRQEVSRAERQKSLLVCAMLDVDHFKAVNDRYGHTHGDRVLRSLTQLLTLRLGHLAAVGRYGGEEFALVFPGLTADEALWLLNEVREGFARIQHRVGPDEFSVTFSGGVADYADYPEPAALWDAADQALYAAKGQGRNCIVRAPAR